MSEGDWFMIRVLGGGGLLVLLFMGASAFLILWAYRHAQDYWWARYIGPRPLHPREQPRRPEPISDEPPVRYGEPLTDLDLDDQKPRTGQRTTDFDVRGP